MRFRVKRFLRGGKALQGGSRERAVGRERGKNCRPGAGERGAGREAKKSKKQGAGSGLAPRALVLIGVFCQNT